MALAYTTLQLEDDCLVASNVILIVINSEESQKYFKFHNIIVWDIHSELTFSLDSSIFDALNINKF